jgi:hypothetical protein
MNPAEVKALAKKMAEECYAALPEKLNCGTCRTEQPKEEFGVRVPRRKSDGMPYRAGPQSRCRTCRKQLNKRRSAVAG